MNRFSIALVGLLCLFITLRAGAEPTSNTPAPDIAVPVVTQSNAFLSIEDRLWLQSHPDLRLSGDVFWPPFEFIDDKGDYVGMVSDVVSLIEKRLDYKFNVNHQASWGETLEGFQNHEVDLISAVAKTPQREEYMLFTEPFFSFPIVLVIREGLGFVTDLRELDDELVGVVKGYASYDYLIINHPDLNLQVVETVDEGLQALADGELDVFVSNIPSVSYLIKQKGLFNVRLTSITPYVYDLRVAVQKDNPRLHSILNKVIASIPQKEFDKIYKFWVFKDMKSQVDYRMVRRIAFVSILVIGIFLYWNRKLSKEVTERIKSEEALRRSKDQLRLASDEAKSMAHKADEANRAKSIFLANMSHEIRTPMNAVMGYTELLSAAVKDKKQRSYLDSIRTGSKALLTLINDILDLSKVEAGKLHIEYRPTSLAPLFDELQQIFFAKVNSEKLQLSIDLAHDLPLALMLDETRLRQVLFNLVGNAIKFTHKGSIRVKVTAKPSGPSPSQSNLVDLFIEVKDSGIGIPNDQQERIFRAFEQQEGQSTREYGGTGLGLAISKKLVEVMGGELSLYSEVNKGACFTVKLPQVECATHDQLDILVLPELSQYQFEPAKILIVDDVVLNRELVKDLLENTGFIFKEAENGKQSVQVTQEWLPDLILMDIRMPVMDGYEATKAIKQCAETSNIPVVALTASVMSKDEYRITEAGFNGYLKKPVSGNELYAELALFLPHKLCTKTTYSTSLDSEVEHSSFALNREEWETVKTQFLAQWEKVYGSGDIAGVISFADDVYNSAIEANLTGLKEYAGRLKIAAENFDLDEVQVLLEGLNR